MDDIRHPAGATGEDRPPVPAALGEIAQLIDELQACPAVWRMADGELMSALDTAYSLADRLQGLGVSLVGEVESRGLAREAGAPSTRAWLKARRRLRAEHAKRDTAVAAFVPSPDNACHVAEDAVAEDAVGAATGTALAAGEISVEHAGVVVRAMDELPDDLSEATRVTFEAEMVAHARRVDPRELTIFGHRLLERVDPDAADRKLAEQLEREEREARRKRSATRYVDGHGSVFYRLRVPEGDDAGIWPVLDTLAAPRPRGAAGRDPRDAKQRLADAFCEAFRRVGLDGGLPSNGGDRPRVVVTISLSALVTGLGYGMNLDTGAVLSPTTVRRLACDAQVVPAVLGGAGQVLDLGKARRTFDGPVRTVVVLRDGGCVHPGCDRPARWCDVHHVVPWWAGGDTRPGNGVVLCGFHHRLYDDGEWSIRFADDGIPEAIPPPWIDTQRCPIRHSRFLARRRPPAA